MAEVIITKTITKTFKITNVASRFMKFDENYRRIRGNYKYKGFQCFLCKKDFKDGDDIGVIFSDKGNKTVCTKCAEETEEKLKSFG